MNIKLGKFAFLSLSFFTLFMQGSSLWGMKASSEGNTPEVRKVSRSPSKQKQTEEKKKAPTLCETFEQLEPFGAVRYKKALSSFKDKGISERFKAIDGPMAPHLFPKTCM